MNRILTDNSPENSVVLGGHPFGDRLLDAGQIERLLAAPVFKDINPAEFPSTTPLASILAYHGRIRRFFEGEMIVMEGDYGHSVFAILSGELRGLAPGQGRVRSAVRKQQTMITFFKSLAQLWQNARITERRQSGRIEDHGNGRDSILKTAILEKGANQPRRKRQDRRTRQATSPYQGPDRRQATRKASKSLVRMLPDVAEVIANQDTFCLGPGDIFGEIAALTRTSRQNTVFVASPMVEVFELRWQGLRELRRWSSYFCAYVDKLYRERGLEIQVAENHLFKGLDGPSLQRLIAHIQYGSYGNFEWTAAFQRQSQGKESAGNPPPLEQDIYLQGAAVNEIGLIRSGFVRVVETRDGHQQTVGYLGKNDFVGGAEIRQYLESGTALSWQNSYRALGYADILRIPVDPLLETLSNMDSQQLASLAPRTKGTAGNFSLLDFLVDKRLINGTQAMLIDNRKCVECDECVIACAQNHDNNPRFVRKGENHGPFLVANACMHCIDPVCLIGCPTGAISRDTESGAILIEDASCIGCSTCANACPYGNIEMVAVNDSQGNRLLKADGSQEMRATKCDLCTGKSGGPACVRACPTGALSRVDLHRPDQVGNLFR
ncbi:MAG: cyclic nucleotide-binding domain-containing protein [Rhodospirillales bacterium]|nr:cyclic nucleotide-binding domain-containing protein [Rhodospirillales bacterium]